MLKIIKMKISNYSVTIINYRLYPVLKGQYMLARRRNAAGNKPPDNFAL
jgi:hypothetical protein